MWVKVIIYFVYMVIMKVKSIKYYWLLYTKGLNAARGYVFKLYRKWSRFTIKIIGVQVILEGVDNIPDEPFVLMGNHTSILDVPLLISSIDKDLGFIAKKEVLKIPLIGCWLEKGKNVALDRDNARQGIMAINEGVNNIKEGYAMVVFPEGTRSKDGSISEFKKGSMKLATKSKAKIVPVYIDRAYRSFEENRRFKPNTIKIIIEKPIETSSLTKEDERNLAGTVRNKIVSASLIQKS